MKMIALVLALALAGCSGLKPQAAYVQGDRDTKDFLDPFLAPLFDEDPNTNPAPTELEREIGRQVLESWRLRLEAGERANR